MIGASYLTLAGAVHGKGPQYSALERAKAAHAVGIPSIGVLWNEYVDPDVLKYADIMEVEWFELADPHGADEMRAVKRLHEEFGVTVVKTGLCSVSTSRSAAVDCLSRVLEMANRHDMVTAFEPVAWGNLPDLSDVLPILNGSGVCYDLWQLAVGTPQLPAFSASDIAKVEVSGVPAQYRKREHDEIVTMAMDRPLIAESLDAVRTGLADLKARGYTGLITYEQPCARWRELSLMETAEAAVADMSLIW